MSDQIFQTGDVFLFEHDDSCISRLICKLSHSPISHAAMYFENEMIIEEGLPQIGTRPITKLGDRAVHVRRYRRWDKSGEKLLQVARRHLEAETPYSMGNLVTVGILLVFNSWKPGARWAVKQALSAVCILLAKAIDKKKLHGKKGATCSQLVYEMYEEAGFPLTINRKNDTVMTGSVRLLDEALGFAESAEMPVRGTDMASKNGFDLEKACCALLAVLGEPDEATDMAAAEMPEVELYQEVIRFAGILAEADLSVADLPVMDAATQQNGFSAWAKKALGHLLENYSGFVSPGQLYSDCPDLAQEIAVLQP